MDFQILLLLYLQTLLLCPILLFGCCFYPLPSRCQTVWIQIRPEILSGLIWVEIVCKGYQQTSKCLAGSEFKLFVKVISRQQKWAKSYIQKKLVYTTFWLKPWHMATTFSIWIKCWLQQILSQS